MATFAVAVLSGATAAVTGFGIGSLLTPFLATRYDAATAIAAVALPHALATALRAWRLRLHVDVGVLRRFGLWSAAGGLAGAILYTRAGSPLLTAALAVLLILTGVAGITRWTERIRPKGPLVLLLGAASGFFGGLAGNQGGIRSAALLSFALPPLAFVATATATGLLVDAVRMPLYLWTAGAALAPLALPIALASVGVLIGTVLGEHILFGLERDRFRFLVSVAVGALGVWLLVSLV